MNENVIKKVLKASGITAVVFIVCVILCLLAELIVILTAGKFEFIHAGDRWSSDGSGYAVVSLYTEEGSALSYDQITQWSFGMDAALLAASVTPAEGARSWTYSAVCESTQTVAGPKGRVTAEVMAVCGDFFTVHPMNFVFGSPFLNDNSNPMGIVLDRYLAWELFGAENIIGMPLEIGGYEFIITGIVEKETDRGMYGYTYGDRPRMYMSYAGYSKISSAGSDITVFEAVLPNAFSSFAKNIFDGVVSYNQETASAIEVSDRFSLAVRFENMKLLPYSWIRSNRIEYPYWENEARAADFGCAVLMIFEIAFAAIGTASMLLSFILLRVSGYTFFDTLKNTYRKIKKNRSRNYGNKNKKSADPQKRDPRHSRTRYKI